MIIIVLWLDLQKCNSMNLEDNSLVLKSYASLKFSPSFLTCPFSQIQSHHITVTDKHVQYVRSELFPTVYGIATEESIHHQHICSQINLLM